MQINSDNGDEVKEIDRFGNDVSGGSRGGARGGATLPPLSLDQTEARGPEKKFFKAGPSSYLRDWMTRLPLYLKVWTRHWTL